MVTDNTLDESQLPLTALVNGKRGFLGGIPINTNLCYSNPDVVESFAEKVVAYAKNTLRLITFMYGWPMLPITIVNVKIVKSPYRLIYMCVY